MMSVQNRFSARESAAGSVVLSGGRYIVFWVGGDPAASVFGLQSPASDSPPNLRSSRRENTDMFDDLISRKFRQLRELIGLPYFFRRLMVKEGPLSKCRPR